MKTALIIFVFFVALACIGALPLKEEKGNSKIRFPKWQGLFRNRRNIAQFGKMVLCETGRSPLDYNWYGCYCGFGGKGVPVDAVDQCCYDHDHCYSRARSSGKCSWPLQIYYEVYNREGCSGCVTSKNNECEQALCECDSAAAKCFAANRWNKEYDNHSQSKC